MGSATEGADKFAEEGDTPTVAGTETDRRWPEDGGHGAPRHRLRGLMTSVADTLFYAYMGRVLRRGAVLHRSRGRRRQPSGSGVGEGAKGDVEEMSMGDLYRAPRSMEASRLREDFGRLHAAEAAARDDGGRGCCRRGRKGRDGAASRRSAFMGVLWGLSRPTYVPAGLWQLAAVLSQCAIPLLVRQILLLLEANPGRNFVRAGMPIAAVLFAVSVIEGVANERQKFLSFQTGIALRAAIVNAVYDHVLGLTPEGKAGLTAGTVTNLVAIDAQKLFELTQEGHQIWSCPLAMVIVTVLLLLELGPTVLVGMASMFLMVPIVQKVVMTMMHIRKDRVAETDRRVEATAAMLQGMKFTKLNHYEHKFLQKVTEAREKEMRLLRKELAVLACTFFLTVVSPVIASALTFTCYVLVVDGNTLTAATTFTTLFLFAALRFPINNAGKLMGKAAQGIQACQRFADFFSRESMSQKPEDSEPKGTDKDESSALLTVTNGRFTVGHSEMDTEANSDLILSKTAFTVSVINVMMKRSEVLCIVGPVASGKTTLVRGLIGDITPSSDSIVEIKGRVAYGAQAPFILNATVRDNILFGAEYDEDRFHRVLEACCLLPDLDQIGPARDLTEIGERGVTLSGGQKQRVSLARVAYAAPDVAVFDDPLSALDAATGTRAFERLFEAEDSPLAESAVVLVTHASHFLSRVDSILVLSEGRQAFAGSWESLRSCQLTDPAAKDAVAAILSAVQEESSEEDRATQSKGDTKKQEAVGVRGGAASGGDIMTVEEREFGLSNWRTWTKWFKYSGGVAFVSIAVLGLGVDRFAYVATEWWLASWTSGASEPIERFGRTFPPQSQGRSAQYEYLVVYVIILLISFAGTLFRSEWLVQGGARCSNRLHKLMTSRVLYAPMSYFDTTPLGRILNRFTYDMEMLDVTLSQNMTMLMTSLGWFFAGVILQTVILPWQLLAIGFIMVVYWLLVLHYRKSAVDLQRLDATSRSPIQAQLSEVLDGTSTIRVFQKEHHFSGIFRSCLDENTSAVMNFMAAHRWVTVRIQVVGACAVLFSVCFVVCSNEVLSISPGIAAILIIWSSNFTISLGFMVQAISESEASLTSVERVAAMTELPQEKRTPNDSMDLAKDWPLTGSLRFEDVHLRYRPELPLSLEGLSFSLKSGQRCGVVGRTGAGKSTLTVALFRLVEIERGTIMLDDVDLSKIGLADVRGRRNGMCIIPQDPVLFSGSLRECLDPFGDSSDDEVLDALQTVRVANASERGMKALSDHVDEGGRNFSVGERQLLCLARAILARPRLLVLDEATASVDGETDAFIQRMLRSRFQGTTLLTIAHRLNTIMDYDVILVVDKGKAAEFGSPKELLEKKDGLFSKLVDSTGKESSSVLRAAASGVETL